MLVALRRNIILDGKRFRKAERGVEIPSQYADRLPDDAVILDGTADEKKEFKSAVDARAKELQKKPSGKGDELQRLRLDNKNLLDRLAAIEAKLDDKKEPAKTEDKSPQKKLDI